MTTLGGAAAGGIDGAARRQTAASQAGAAWARVASRDWVALAALLLLAAAIRVPDVTGRGIWLDEGYSLLQTERSLREILALRTHDANPPLYLMVLHAWRTLLGPGLLAARTLSLVAGLAGVALVWLVARARFGRGAAFVAGLIVALSRFHVHYSLEVRGYALLFALVAAADLFFVRWEARGRRRDLCGWLAAGLAAVATHEFAWWMLAVEGALARRRRAAAIGLACVLVATAPLLLSLERHLTTFKTQSWVPRPDLGTLLHALWVLGGCGPVALLVWALALLALGSGVARHLAAGRCADGAEGAWRSVAVPGLQLALPLVAYVLSLLATPMLVERYLLIALLPLACLAGAGVAALPSRTTRALVVAVLALGSIPPLAEQHAQVERASASRAIDDLLRAGYRDGDVVLYTSKWLFVPFVALHPPGMAEYLLPEIAGDEYSSVLLGYTKRPVRRPPPERGQYARLWLVRRPEDRPADIAASDWFRKLTPRLAWQDPSGALLRFDLPP